MRLGAGRPRKTPAPVADAPVSSKANSPAPKNAYSDPMEFLAAVWRGELNATASQIQAARAALPFMHQRPKEPGKKQQRVDAANQATGTQRFAPVAPPMRRIK